MKKLLLILLCLPMLGFGQDDKLDFQKSFEIGAVYGISTNSLNGLDSRDALINNAFDSHIADERPVGGALLQYNFTKLFSIKSKLLYHIKGEGGSVTLVNNGNVIGEAKLQTDFHYLTLPLLAQFNFGRKSSKWRFFCNTGFYLGSLMKVKNELEGAESVYLRNISNGTIIWLFERGEQPLEDFNKFDFGLILGYGVSFQISDRIRILVEVGLDYGLTNASKVELIDDDIILTQAITGIFGLTYNLSKN